MQRTSLLIAIGLVVLSACSTQPLAETEPTEDLARLPAVDVTVDPALFETSHVPEEPPEAGAGTTMTTGETATTTTTEATTQQSPPVTDQPETVIEDSDILDGLDDLLSGLDDLLSGLDDELADLEEAFENDEGDINP